MQFFKNYIIVGLLCFFGYDSIECRRLGRKPNPAVMQTDLIAFSYDRPLQLYALLESIELRMTNLTHQSVIYRVSNDRYDRAYDRVKNRFPTVTFCKQGFDPESDFKELFLKLFDAHPSWYVLFAVDDNILKDEVDISQCIEHMRRKRAYVFALRFGKNITYSYMLDRPIKMPKLTAVSSDVFEWETFGSGLGWHYAHSVDLNLYRKSDIRKKMQSLVYKHPNSLEGLWSFWVPKKVTSLCFDVSKSCGLPINIVHQSPNRNMGLYSTEELLEKFEQGLKIDIEPIKEMVHNSPHVEYSPSFILRGESDA